MRSVPTNSIFWGEWLATMVVQMAVAWLRELCTVSIMSLDDAAILDLTDLGFCLIWERSSGSSVPRFVPRNIQSPQWEPPMIAARLDIRSM